MYGIPAMDSGMQVIGLVGWSGSGKTTLLVKLVEILSHRGIAVSTVKHAHHAFDVDTPGKDSHRHRVAGAQEVMVSSANRWALMHELRGAAEPDLDTLLAQMTPVDLILVEGFKSHTYPKIEVHRPALGHPLLAHGDDAIIAIACDTPPEDTGQASLPLLALDDAEAIADFIVARIGADIASLQDTG